MWASTEVSANITGSSEVERDLQSYPKLGERGKACIPPQSSAIGCGLPLEGSVISEEVTLFS